MEVNKTINTRDRVAVKTPVNSNVYKTYTEHCRLVILETAFGKKD